MNEVRTFQGARPVYLFDGEEEYFKERGEAMLRAKFLREPTLDFSLFRGETLHGGALADLVAAAQSFPFLSEKRIVKVTDFYPSEREYEQYLRRYLEDPPPSTILLIVNSVRPKGRPFDLKKAPGVTWVDCSRGDEETLLRWIFTRFKQAGVRADTECCERILHYCLSDMSRIAGEVEKLIAYAGGAITPNISPSSGNFSKRARTRWRCSTRCAPTTAPCTRSAFSARATRRRRASSA